MVKVLTSPAQNERRRTIYEYDALCADSQKPTGDTLAIPDSTFRWLEDKCLKFDAKNETAWLKLVRRGGCRAVQVTNYVGVIQAPDGYQIEVLPKIGKVTERNEAAYSKIRKILIDMICCLQGFEHIQIDSARIAAAKMPLLDVFIQDFLRTVERIVKRGLRSNYVSRQDNLFALRGKLLMASHLRQNLCRADRFFTEHDEFETDRPENRLLHTALRRVLALPTSHANNRLARELAFAFADVPLSAQPRLDFQRVRLDRGMSYYEPALAWARLILDDKSPVTGAGEETAPSLLFPMEKVFEAFVAKHLAKQLTKPHTLKKQAQSRYLVNHDGGDLFQLRPDLLVADSIGAKLVLDTKWKLLETANVNKGKYETKYGLAQSDFYQLLAYGLNYLDGKGDMVLIYPKTDTFKKPLEVFKFNKPGGLRLWVLPFCLENKKLITPQQALLPCLEPYPA